eukprot:CAMPEP_0198259484 /NCGR_PEP_ID=MMETSP1447-20131203/8664_1 /TAXON_ID=420782 /ORGANISM="Chaetoceros dichaeta, Strain CCMP1751" /LENGTH=347 /DNA_ID=CAMNT_0043946883 /DNA_START=61 /DNA_END=1101 /DNA_ORIENTATION=-
MKNPMAMGNPSLLRQQQRQQQKQQQRQRRTNVHRLTIGSVLLMALTTFHTTFQVVSCSRDDQRSFDPSHYTDLSGSRSSSSIVQTHARSRIRPSSLLSPSPPDLVDYRQAAEAMKKESILRARRRSKQSFELNIERQRSSSHFSTTNPYFLHKNKVYAKNASLLRTINNNNNNDSTIHAIEKKALGLSRAQQQHTYRHSTETDDLQSEDDDTTSTSSLSVSELPPPLPTEERLRERHQQQQQQQHDQQQHQQHDQQLVDNEHDSTEGHNKRGNPVVYRYFGRSRARSVKSESIPFIVLGPRVDHWKLVGRILSSRGFNVMACEQVLTGEEGGRRNSAYAADGNLNPE